MSRLISRSAASRSARETRQRENAVLFGAQGQAQKFVERIAGLRAEPSFHRAPAAIFAQEPRIKDEGRERRAAAPAQEFA